MYLRSLYLQQFRNYREAFFTFDSAFNLICGPNAQGKTSILEAIYYLMMGRSFRPCTHQDLICLGSNSFYIEAIFSKYEVDQRLRIQVKGKERTIIYNNTSLVSITHLFGILQGVVMTPDDVQLIKGPPLLRRQFLDMQIAQVDPLYVHHLTRYTKAIRHRNQLLKHKQVVSIESWEFEMAQAAAYIVSKRKESIRDLQSYAQQFYTYLTQERELLQLEYRSSANNYSSENEIKNFYIQQFEKNRERELILGYTLSGPQKDDLWIGIGGNDIRYFASEGQQRSCVAALHIGEWQRVKHVSGDTPLLMIDDVGISLDESRRERLLEQLTGLGQVFLTTTDTTLLTNTQQTNKIIELPLQTVDS